MTQCTSLCTSEDRNTPIVYQARKGEQLTFNRFNHLGFIAPYWTRDADGRLVLSSTFAGILQQSPKPRHIDSSALVEIISRYHCFADRTLVQGIYRTPWMAKPNAAYTDWEFAEIPPHGEVVISEEEAASQLFAALQLEMLEYCEGHSTVGILLSGGMDSRVVAGTLDYLLRTGQLSLNVVAITWGMSQSRDVIYAQQIAQRLGWDWQHYPISVESLLDNITETAKHGCEYSPVHLHAMPRVRDLEGVDCILAASYGDSVGRAEYSGRHIDKLIPFENYTLNWFKLLRKDIYKEASQRVAGDVDRYRMLFPRTELYQQHEIDQQAHYMRRKLNHCMAVIDEKTPVLQAFTSPHVFGLIWSLSPRIRNDKIYKHLLALFGSEIADIPWARTGKPFLAQGEAADAYPSLHHRYGEWIRGELYPIIREKVLSRSISQLGVFNMQALDSALRVNRKAARQVRTTKMDEVSIWLAALAEFVDMYRVKGLKSRESLVDAINGVLVGPIQIAGLALIKRILSRK